MSYQPISESSYSVPVESSKEIEGNAFTGGVAGTSSRGIPEDQIRLNKYETTIPIRVDIEAALTYLVGCVTGVLFLIIEQKNDYVRFHAWQSCLIFFTMLLLHMIFIWQNVVSFILMAFDFLLIGGLMYKAYIDGQGNLDRFQVPLFGTLAAKWVDSE